MTKALLSTAVAFALLLSAGSLAQARETGHEYQPPVQRMNTQTSWMYSSLCKAAVPVKEVYSYQKKEMPQTLPMVPMTKAKVEEAQLKVYPARDYNYAP